MKQQKKKQKINLPKCILERSTTLYLTLMLGIFPLFFDEYYLNIVLSKKNFFQWSTLGLLAVVLVLGIPAYFCEKENKQQIFTIFFKKNGSREKNISFTDIFAGMFGITMIVSCVFSPVGSEAFWGNEVRRIGGLFFLICIGAYFMVSRYYKSGKLLMAVFLIANFIDCLIVVVQFFGFDIFHMYENLIVEQHVSFMGTMGNINVNAGYFGMIVSVLMGFYYLSTEKNGTYAFGE